MTTPAVPTVEPREITRGETVVWTRESTDYPPADGWTLTTYFRGATQPGLDIVAAVTGNLYKSTITAAQSATLIAGRCDWQVWVVRGTGPTLEQHKLDEGVTKIEAGFPSITSTTSYDGRTDNEKALDAVRAVLAQKATKDQLSYTIGNRQVQHYTFTELIAIESRLTQLVNQEKRADGLKQGLPFFQNVFARFTEPR